MSETFHEDGEQLTEEELAACRALAPTAKRYAKGTRVMADGTSYTLLFRNPTRAEFKQFRSVYTVDGKEMEAFEQLALTLVLRPTTAELLNILEDWPGLITDPIVKPLSRLVGFMSGESAKK